MNTEKAPQASTAAREAAERVANEICVMLFPIFNGLNVGGLSVEREKEITELILKHFPVSGDVTPSCLGKGHNAGFCYDCRRYYD